jgi:hypothetical protein
MAKKSKTTPPDQNGADGVEHDGAGPVYLEKLSADEKAAAGLALAEAELELEQLEADWKKRSSEHRGEKKQLKARIKALGEQVRSGVRKKPAQQALPGAQ